MSFLSDNIIYISIIAVIIVLFTVLFLLIKRARKIRKITQYFKTQFHKIVRNESLQKALNNYNERSDYSYWLIKVFEHNNSNNREHFFHVKQKIDIGRAYKTNEIVVFDENAEPKQCKIFLKNGHVTIKNCSQQSTTIFVRKHRKGRKLERRHEMEMGEELQIYTDDAICFGNTTMKFWVYNNKTGIL